MPLLRCGRERRETAFQAISILRICEFDFAQTVHAAAGFLTDLMIISAKTEVQIKRTAKQIEECLLQDYVGCFKHSQILFDTLTLEIILKGQISPLHRA